MLLTAALTTAGVLSALAQSSNVYSVNVVGYINLTLKPGYTMIANQLDDLKQNKLVNIMPSVPNDTFIFKFNGVGYDSDNFVDGAWQLGGEITMNPGEGAFILIPQRNPDGSLITTATVTFVGEVRQSATVTGPPLNTELPKGYSVSSSQVPQAGAVATDLLFPAQPGDFIFKFSNTSGAYITYTLDPDNGWMNVNTGNFPEEPSIDIGESFFAAVGAATTWSRVFKVQ